MDSSSVAPEILKEGRPVGNKSLAKSCWLLWVGCKSVADVVVGDGDILICSRV